MENNNKDDFNLNNKNHYKDIEIKIQDGKIKNINSDGDKLSCFKNNKINNNFIKIKRKRCSDNKKILYDNKYLDKINTNTIEEINKNENFNNKIIEIIKSDLLDYEPNFESTIKANSKKYFWKHLIFKKFGGQTKLLSEIINDIEKNINKEKKEKKEKKKKKKKMKKKKIEKDINISKINTSKDENLENNELVCQSASTTHTKKIRNNIITIFLDDEVSNDNMISNQISEINNSTEDVNILWQIENTKGLEKELIFLKEFLYNENFFNENQLFYPDSFIEDEDKEINEENLFMQAINLKIYSIIKIIYPNLDYNIIKKNIKYLDYLANSIDKLIGNKYELIIEMIFGRLNKEAEKILQKNNKSNNYFF